MFIIKTNDDEKYQYIDGEFCDHMKKKQIISKTKIPKEAINFHNTIVCNSHGSDASERLRQKLRKKLEQKYY